MVSGREPAGTGLGEGLVVVVAADGYVIALAADDGAERWRALRSLELAEAFDPDRALVSTPTACGPVRTGPARRRPAAVVKPKNAANAA